MSMPISHYDNNNNNNNQHDDYGNSINTQVEPIFDLNMVSLQKFETNSFTAFFSSEIITTLWIGIFMLKCSKSRIFHSQSFEISSSIFQRSFLRTFVSKMGLSADYAASYRCFQFIIG